MAMERPHSIAQPPSTGRSTPVIWRAASLARKRQAFDIAVNRYALERVFGRVPLSRFLDADAEALGHIGADLVAEAGAVDHARCYAIDVDVILAHLQRKTLGDPAQTPFGRGIGHAPCPAAHAKRTAD